MATLTNPLQRALNSPFLFQLICLSVLMTFVLSFRPPITWTGSEFGAFNAPETTYFRLADVGFLENVAHVSTAGFETIVDAEGNETRVKKKRDKVIDYVVKNGDNASKVAYRFGLKVSTLLWANDLNVKSQLTPGETLRIPPVDGVYYTVKSRETLGEIAKAHEVNIQKINNYNPIQNNVIQVGQEIFIPDAQKTFIAAKPEPKPVAVNYRNTRGAITTPAATPRTLPRSSHNGISSLNYKLRRPTQGVLTQGYRRGHYAIDIASKRNTPIYAAAAGTVRVSQSGWNYGYGTYVIIDHGNGVETLYSHNNVNKVRVGDYVQAGQLIALMGNTGRVFGVTGIHLHFELRINGRKANPYNYF